MSLTQAADGTISGTGSYVCPGAYSPYPITISGSAAGSGTFTVSFFVHCATDFNVNDTITIPQGAPGCDSGSASGTTSYSSLTNQYCYLPPSKGTTSFLNFAPGRPGVALFSATVPAPTGDSAYIWAGRTVREYFSDTPTDNCNPGLTVAATGVWDISGGNTLGNGDLVNGNPPDALGWNYSTTVDQQRAHPANIPCTHTQTQRLQMDCPSNTTCPNGGTASGGIMWCQYGSDTLSYGIGSTTITLSRDGVGTTPANQTFGTPQNALAVPIVTSYIQFKTFH
jgi:hypothetical protein